MDETLDLDVIQKYPWLGKFGTKTEIDAYLAGNKVQCLLCGKLFKALPQHLERTHDITADDYREQYGLPWKRGLCGVGTSEKLSKNMLERQKKRVPATHRSCPEKICGGNKKAGPTILCQSQSREQEDRHRKIQEIYGTGLQKRFGQDAHRKQGPQRSLQRSRHATFSGRIKVCQKKRRLPKRTRTNLRTTPLLRTSRSRKAPRKKVQSRPIEHETIQYNSR